MPKDTILLKNIGWIYTFNEKNEIIRNGFLLLKGEKIEKIGSAKDPLPPADKVIDLEGAVLLPGLINVHHHFYQNITRAVPKTLKCSLLEWLKYLYALWAFLEPEDIKLATQIAVSELLLSGSTTTSDFFYLFPHHQYDLFDLEVNTALEMGMRLHAIRGCLPVLEGALSTQLKEIKINQT